MAEPDAIRKQRQAPLARSALSSPPSNQVSLKNWMGVFGSILGAFIAVLDIQITNASLQDIQAALGTTLEEGSWISTAYLVAEIVAIPVSSWLSRVFPRAGIC